jgi:STE24 endopeptidase
VLELNKNLEGRDIMILSIIGIFGILLVLLLNKWVVSIYKNKVLKYYERNKDQLLAITYIRKLGRRYWPMFILNIFGLVFSFLLVLYEWIENFNYMFFMALLLALIIYFIIGIRINKTFLKLEIAIKGAILDENQFKMMNRLIGLYFINAFQFLTTIISLMLICQYVYYQSYDSILILFSMIIVMGVIYLIIMNKNALRIYKKILNAKEYQNESLQALVDSVYPNVQLYYFEAKEIKYAQALVLDKKEKVIFISNYLIENLTFDELKAVIYHELGHLHYNHTKKRSNYILLGYLLFIIVNFIGLFLFEKSGLLTLMVLLFLYAYFFVIKNKIYQRQEHDADTYTLKFDINKETIISMLVKLSDLTMTQRKGNKSDAYLSTHPVYQKRIDFINN